MWAICRHVPVSSILYAIAAAGRPDSGQAIASGCHELGDLCHSGVSLRGFASRIETVRRSFTLDVCIRRGTDRRVVSDTRRGWCDCRLTQRSQQRRSASPSHRTCAHAYGRDARSRIAARATRRLFWWKRAGGDRRAGSSGNTAVTTPADPSIAAGPSNVVEAVNSALFVYARTGGTPTVFSINTMINNPSSGWAVRYPHVVYDPISGRFILMVLAVQPIVHVREPDRGDGVAGKPGTARGQREERSSSTHSSHHRRADSGCSAMSSLA